MPTDWLTHIIELRKCLLKVFAALILLFIILIYFANPLYHLLALPLLHRLPSTSHMIATEVTTPIFVPIRLALYLSIFIIIPYASVQLWNFIAPALYQNEKKYLWPSVIFSALLFYLGLVFAYFVILPLLFHFIISATPKDVTMMTDISAYLSFVMKIFLAFGMMFEIPLLMLIIVKANLITLEKLIELRPYVIVSAFIIGMFVAPPDVLSQTILALPMWWLYEIGVLAVRYVKYM